MHWKHFLGYPEYIYILSGANLYLFGRPGATWVCSKLQGLAYYFPENFRCNFKFYESENFSDSSLNRILNAKMLGFLFYEKWANLGTEEQKIKL